MGSLSFLRHEKGLHIHLFQLQQLYFLIDPAGIACQAAICPHDTVTRHNDGDLIVAYRAAYGLC